MADQLQPGKVGTDFRLLAVVRVAVGAVVEQFHNGNVKAFAAVGFTENVATVLVNFGLLFVDQKPCAFRNLRLKQIVRCEDHRAGDVFVLYFKAALTFVKVNRDVFVIGAAAEACNRCAIVGLHALFPCQLLYFLPEPTRTPSIWKSSYSPG